MSWKKCIQNYYGKYSDTRDKAKRLNDAFRSEIETGTKRKFYNQHARDSCCENCGKNNVKMTVDHYPAPFKCILNDFLIENEIDKSKLTIFKSKSGNITKLTDAVIADDWQRFHDKHATYRVLCGPCNSGFGSYGL